MVGEKRIGKEKNEKIGEKNWIEDRPTPPFSLQPRPLANIDFQTTPDPRNHKVGLVKPNSSRFIGSFADVEKNGASFAITYVKIAPIFDLVRDIDTTKTSWAIKLRIVQVYKQMRYTNPNEVFSLDFISHDKEGDTLKTEMRNVRFRFQIGERALKLKNRPIICNFSGNFMNDCAYWAWKVAPEIEKSFSWTLMVLTSLYNSKS
ncbi:Uncharacterized protein Fot_11783 [Forsythia ovata]|uniref:Replication protein A 70 kDa DNA-binding subunit B/D first OB fold domain-containing protein n=1 Tax=Forsythia ovata TaxID=205694 RepID=A0ABD1WNC8_9LAMI